MKKTDDEDALFRLANYLFPDDTELAIFNMMGEILTGRLPTEAIAGDAGLAVRDGVELRAVWGVTMLDDEASRVYWYDEPAAGDAELERMLRRLYATAAADVQRERADLKGTRTVAALALYVTPDGEEATLLHRHPAITHDQAVVFAKTAFDDVKPGADDWDPDPPPEDDAGVGKN